MTPKELREQYTKALLTAPRDLNYSEWLESKLSDSQKEVERLTRQGKEWFEPTIKELRAENERLKKDSNGSDESYVDGLLTPIKEQVSDMMLGAKMYGNLGESSEYHLRMKLLRDNFIIRLSELTRLCQENERQRATLARWTSIREANHWEDWVERWIHLFESKEQADDVYYSARSDVEVHYQEGVRFLELSREQVASLRQQLSEAREAIEKQSHGTDEDGDEICTFCMQKRINGRHPEPLRLSPSPKDCIVLTIERFTEKGEGG